MQVTGVLVDLGAAQPGAAATAQSTLAQNREPPPGQGAEFGKASPIALVVILLLGIATVLLIRSMTKHLKRLPASFETDDPLAGSSRPAAPTRDRWWSRKIG